MNIRLDLSRHCIETEIKKQYNIDGKKLED